MYLEHINIYKYNTLWTLTYCKKSQEKVISYLNIEKNEDFVYRKWNCHEKVQLSILLKYWVKEIKEKSMSGKNIITTDQGKQKYKWIKT